MPTRALLAVILVVAATPVRAGDFVVAYERANPRFGKPRQLLLHQHGQQMRLDETTPSGEIVQTFVKSGRNTWLAVTRRTDGSVRVLSLMEDALAAPAAENRRTYSGETRTMLGRTCRVWSASLHPNPSLTQTGCLTPDGVELVYRDYPYGEMTAVSVTPARTAAKDVRPPTELLNLARWAQGPQDHAGDYHVRLGLMEMWRSGPWVRIDEVHGESREVRLINASAGVVFRYMTDGKDRRQLSIMHDVAMAGFTGDTMTRSDSVILGKTCQWWNMTALVADFSERQCRTSGGAILKIERSGRAGSREMQAATYEEGPQSWTVIAPEAEIASAKAWGF